MVFRSLARRDSRRRWVSVDLGQAQAGAERERNERVVADVPRGRAEDGALLIGRQGRGGEVRHGGLLAAQVRSVGEEVKSNVSTVRALTKHDGLRENRGDSDLAGEDTSSRSTTHRDDSKTGFQSTLV